jgi:hypothetical protein
MGWKDFRRRWQLVAAQSSAGMQRVSSQVGFLHQMAAVHTWLGLDDFADRALRQDVGHVISDMNTCAVHMLTFLLQRWECCSRRAVEAGRLADSERQVTTCTVPRVRQSWASALCRRLSPWSRAWGFARPTLSACFPWLCVQDALRSQLIQLLDHLLGAETEGRKLGSAPPLDGRDSARQFDFTVAAVRKRFRQLGCKRLALAVVRATS